MFQYHRVRALFYLNSLFQSSPPPSPKCYLFLKLHYPLPLSFNFFSTTTSDQQLSFTISYLTKNCGFSPQAALRASKRVRFGTAQKPGSAISFFQNHGFSISQIHSIFCRSPELLVCNHIKRVLPKFQFLASKGASPTDIVATVIKSPKFLLFSLEKNIIPTYELVRKFCPSDLRAVSCVIACPNSIGDARVKSNVKMLLDVGVIPSNIYHVLRTRPSILCSADLGMAVEEVKRLGFDPCKLDFSVALLAKKAMSKTQWDAKVDAFKRWGWSEDAIFRAFKKHPNFMLRSSDKINAVMSFWISKLGWDASVLLGSPILFGYSLERRLIPRASVVQYLLSKGLIKKDANLVTPFCLSDQLFLQKFVSRFEKETSKLLRLYQGEC